MSSITSEILSTSKLEPRFIKAARLLLPDLAPDDSRIIDVARYAQVHYYSKGCDVCVLCATPNAVLATYKNFSNFCKARGIDPGRREVIITRDEILYSSDFHTNQPHAYKDDFFEEKIETNKNEEKKASKKKSSSKRNSPLASICNLFGNLF